MNHSSKPTSKPDTIRVRIRRFDPALDRAPRYDQFEVPAKPLMRIIDVLDHVHETLQVDIGYRWLCTSKKCGTCAVKVNGSPKLACWDEASPDMTIEPLDNLPVVRDLVTSRDGYQDLLAKISPLLVRKRDYPGFPEPVTERDFAPMVHLRECIQCLACQSVCPVFAQPGSGFAGPAILVQLSDLAQDPRDDANRADLADRVAQVFKCVSCYECERACPTEIPIVGEAIEPLKRLASRAGTSAGARRARAFLGVAEERGTVNGVLVALRAGKFGFGAFRLGVRLLRRGKINLVDALFGKRSSGSDALRRAHQVSEKRP
ncbi:MAG: 4Fe-4S dicluster domain-containing protein [Rhodospirillales bacterium]|nr:4Fe-4S dicluster domain-containing protein [Rhodospirillales bacterium]